ncbi:MAG: beta-galactosidase trimerization domain-containing protein [Chloroflexota bacterium]
MARVSRREALRRAMLGGLALAAGALAACEVAAPPPTPRPIPTAARKDVQPTPAPPPPTPDTGGVTRILLEAEDFVPDGAVPGTSPREGWRAIRVGQGNYMVDSIGASHVSGERFLYAPADCVGARATLETSIPKPGPYRLLARYEYPFREYHARMAITVEQAGRPPARVEIGAPGTTRAWFFNLDDAPWHDLPNGAEGLVMEGGQLDLVGGKARVSVEVLDGPEPAANRVLDLLLLTTDLEDSFKARGTRAYPILDELGVAAAGRAFMRITNPGDSGESFTVDARYTVNRVPWTFPSFTIDKTGITRTSGRPQRMEPGERSPWVDVSSRDTTHPSHLALTQVNNSQNRRVTLLVELASAPSDSAILRTIEYREEAGSRLLLNLPPFPARAPQEIETGEETLGKIVAALEKTPAPVGKVPVRTLVYGGLGDDAERNLTGPARIYQLYRRLFMLLGLNAFNRLGVGGLPVEVQALREDGRTVGKFQMLGDFRWFPSDDNIGKARRDLDAVQGQPYLRGFSYGDEVGLSNWAPKDGRDDGLRAMLQGKGFQPEDVMPADDAASVTRRPLDQRWRRVKYVDDEEDARKTPRLYVESHRYLVTATLDRLAAASGRLREAFGNEIVYGPNFSPHPFFWPELALWVQAFRRGAINRASHSDYWWQVSELGPQMSGYLLDVFRCGMRDRPGVIQTYAMPHSPGTTDADFRRSVVTAIAHGAKALDYFQVTPEQANTENYIRHDDLSRYQTVRDVTYELGAVDDSIVDGKLRPATVGLILSESTDLWDRVTAGAADGLRPDDADDFPSTAYNAERKCLWTALRHAQVPVDVVVEDDLIDGSAARYRVLFLAGDRLSRAAAVGLTAWVRDGGTLISMAGGGFKDEYNEPIATLLPVFGLKDQTLEKVTTFIRPRIELPRLKPLDSISTTVNGESVQLPALAFRQRLDPLPTTEVLARFSDGSPAATSNRFARGQAILWGSLLGAAYVQSGFPSPLPPPDRGPFTHTPLSGFRTDWLGVLVGPALPFARRGAECSEPLVETGLLETDRAILVPIACLLDGPRDVQLTIHEVGPAKRVWSVRRGPLPLTQDGTSVRTSLTLDVSDFVVVER